MSLKEKCRSVICNEEGVIHLFKSEHLTSLDSLTESSPQLDLVAVAPGAHQGPIDGIKQLKPMTVARCTVVQCRGSRTARAQANYIILSPTRRVFIITYIIIIL